jgi:hypothetical protein
MRELGPQWILPLMRLVQLGFILMVVVVGMSLEASLVIKVPSILIILAICISVGHPFANIAGDGQGLHVQRYKKVYFVRWADVSGACASLKDSGIRVDFRYPIGGLRYAVANFPNMAIREAGEVIVGGKDMEIVTWIREHIQDAQKSPSSSVLGLE